MPLLNLASGLQFDLPLSVEAGGATASGRVTGGSDTLRVAIENSALAITTLDGLALAVAGGLTAGGATAEANASVTANMNGGSYSFNFNTSELTGETAAQFLGLNVTGNAAFGGEALTATVKGGRSASNLLTLEDLTVDGDLGRLSASVSVPVNSSLEVNLQGYSDLVISNHRGMRLELNGSGNGGVYDSTDNMVGAVTSFEAIFGGDRVSLGVLNPTNAAARN